MFNKRVLVGAFTLSGTIMGAGILGLPYVFSKSGFFPGLFWLICLAAVTTFINLALGEVILRTKGRHQLVGYAEKYLGKTGRYLMTFSVIFGIYSALLAYLIGEGRSFSQLLPGSIDPFLLGLTFWLIMTLLLREGLKGLKKVETYGVIAIILLIFGAFIKFLPQIQTKNLLNINLEFFTFPIGVILFALLGFTSIPELKEEIKKHKKDFKKAILIGSIIPPVLYIIFTLVFVGVLGDNVTEIATLSFGPLITLIGIFTMLTSYFVLSFSLKDTFKYDLGLSKHKNFILTSLVPIILYALVYFLGFANFSAILGIGGVISAGSTGILILLMNKKAKSKNKGKIEINMPMNWLIIFFLCAIFLTGIILQFTA